MFVFNKQVLAERIEISGKVTYVFDGDTLALGPVRIRLEGIKVPEIDSQIGVVASKFLRKIILNKEITCHLTGKKSYDRFVGQCFYGGTDIATYILEAGLGRDCRIFSKGRYLKYETVWAKSNLDDC